MKHGIKYDPKLLSHGLRRGLKDGAAIAA